MDSGDHPHFSSKDEEIQYWKEFVERLMNEKDNLQVEFDDYTSNSEQLEKEYEASIEQNEKTIRELRGLHTREQNEKESLKLKLEQATHENEQLQVDLTNLKDERAKWQKMVRVLEQKNDDLERSTRTVSETVAACEASLNNVIERNAILESEIDEKESLKEKVQRLVDETRDLRQELHVKERCPDNERILNGHSQSIVALTAATTAALNGNTCNGVIDSNRLKVECETQTTPAKRDASRSSLLDRPLTPSSRVLALNIIGELMRKIGQLEAKLGQCRPDYRSSTESIRRRHTSRGRTSPSLQPLSK